MLTSRELDGHKVCEIVLVSCQQVNYTLSTAKYSSHIILKIAYVVQWLDLAIHKRNNTSVESLKR